MPGTLLPDSLPIVVVTGAAGTLGQRLVRLLDETGGYRLRLIDIDPRGSERIRQADLSRYSRDWVDFLRGADTLVHFAANPSLAARWPDLTSPNVDAVINLYRAVAETRIRRVLLASSVWAMASRRDDFEPVGTPPADPGNNPYGASKLFAECLAQAYADSHGIATLAMRIGGCPAGANPPPRQDRWSNDCWLSTADFGHAMACALRARIDGFQIVNLTSANPANRWSLAEAHRLIGYRPMDVYCAPPIPSQASLLRRIVRRLREMAGKMGSE